MLKIAFLGGVGEFGKNMTVYEQDGSLLVVDAGAMFPEGDIPGIDLIIPDFGFLESRREDLKGLVLTHGHEDHIGAAPFLMERIPCPLWGSRVTLGLVRRKLRELGLKPPSTGVMKPGEPFRIGPFEVEPVPVTHSIPEAFSLIIRTRDATVFHSGDFKFDQSPLDGWNTDYGRIQEEGNDGVDVLLADSTNARVKGFSGTELTVRRSLEKLIGLQEGRLFLTMFSTNLQRIQGVYNLAEQYGRKVACFGRSMVENTRIAGEVGYLRIPAEVSIRVEDVAQFPPEDVIVLLTGSQGEPMAALSRVVFDQSRHLYFEEGDSLLYSARVIPGNEKRVGRIFNELCRKGVRAVTADDEAIHVSGHACSEEVKFLASWVRPHYYVPVHGEFRQLSANADLARDVGISDEDILLSENGEALCFEDGLLTGREQVPVGSQLIDGESRDPVDKVVVRDRRFLSNGGMLVPVVVVDRASGAMRADPEIISRGFPFLDDDPKAMKLVRDEVRRTMALLEREGVRDPDLVRAKIKSRVKKTLKVNDQGIPLIIPTLIEM